MKIATYICHANDRFDRFTVCDLVDDNIGHLLTDDGQWGGTEIATGKQDSSWTLEEQNVQAFLDYFESLEAGLSSKITVKEMEDAQ